MLVRARAKHAVEAAELPSRAAERLQRVVAAEVPAGGGDGPVVEARSRAPPGRIGRLRVGHKVGDLDRGRAKAVVAVTEAWLGFGGWVRPRAL